MNIFDRNGAFAAVGGTAVEAWDTVTGKTPVLWTESALGAGVEQSAYEKWLRWYGKETRNGLWSPLLKAHRLQRAAFAGAVGSENRDVAGFENSDGDNDETEAEEN